MEKKKTAPAEYLPGQVVHVVGGTYRGQAGQVRGAPDEKGALPLLIGGKVRRVMPENIGGK